jgi:hypothetical protein
LRNWYSLKLAQGWKEPGRDICWLEAIAIEILFHFLIQLWYHDIHLLIHSDNKAAIGALSKSRSPNVHLNLCARRTQVLGSDHMIVKKLIYVESRLNPADRPSRGLASSSLPLHNRLCKAKFPITAGPRRAICSGRLVAPQHDIHSRNRSHTQVGRHGHTFSPPLTSPRFFSLASLSYVEASTETSPRIDTSLQPDQSEKR